MTLDFARPRYRSSLLNLTPLIDVVFLLIVFFMLTSSFMQQESMEISFPAGAVTTTAEEAPLILVVADRGRIFLQNKHMELADIAEAVREPLEQNPHQRIVVMSTSNVTVQELVHVMDAVYQAGGQNVSVSSWEY